MPCNGLYQTFLYHQGFIQIYCFFTAKYLKPAVEYIRSAVLALYFLTYDLCDNANYLKLINELEKLGAIRVLEATWCLKKENSSVELIRDHFKAMLSDNDGLVVSEVNRWAALNAERAPLALS